MIQHQTPDLPRDQISTHPTEKGPINRFQAAVTNIPDHKKRDRGGEDAWILTEELLAVADGVGGWNRKGVNPGIFARELCANVWGDYKQMRQEGKKCSDINIRQLLINAVARTKATGTSTFVMAMMEREEAVLKTLNLGDSGFLIVRQKDSTSDFELVFRSKEQQYRFNYPYQCGTNYGPPTHADVHAHMVQDKDIVILATDGVLDNLFDNDILSCVQKGFGQEEVLAQLAASACIGQTAEGLSFRKDYDSPFAQNARTAGRNHPGGKKDDITVVVGQVNLATKIQ
ncbi:hypothetical protein FGO68_gene3286 [Halteria grandinella]|uniref:Protein phosphatase n=1 Tax=Halteria grandinella TaxID=5974 RepID=A0A8J8NLX8_HALGN|nr:hypothetical protein FGO68_gene3286 [Halteria grandinella]